MSAFGDNNFKSDVFENLNWIVSDNPIEQLNFLHEINIEIIQNGIEYINDYIANFIKERNLTIEEAKECLGEVYSYILAYYTNNQIK